MSASFTYWVKKKFIFIKIAGTDFGCCITTRKPICIYEPYHNAISEAYTAVSHGGRHKTVFEPETCTARTAALGQKNSQNYFKEKSIFMSSGRYLCIVYVKLRAKKQNVIDRIIIVKRKPNFTISTTKNYFA